MNPHTNEQPPSDELPFTASEHQDTTMHEAKAAMQVEQGKVASASGGAQPQGPTTTQSDQSSQPPVVDQSAQHAGAQAVAQPSQVATPSIADDEDLIEKEWVLSAKRIVEQTQGDPHTRSENLSSVKKDYKKKRFNIDHDLGAED